VEGILKGDRIVLAKGITMIESTLASDQILASRIIEGIISHTGKSIRIGISGSPGVGKSTFIESFGRHITSAGNKLAVLTIDPSSQKTGGSILGDKTRMSELASNPNAFIRPSASADALGGVARKTRETILLCEAAGYDVIVVETVGVGQSETAVKNMTDVFVLLMLAGSGDELQGIKKGIMEMADLIVITKADGDNSKRAREACLEFRHAVHLLFSSQSSWIPKVITASAFEGEGIRDTWDLVLNFIEYLKKNNSFETNRRNQNISHFHEQFDALLLREIRESHQLDSIKSDLEQRVKKKELSPHQAGQLLFNAFKNYIKGSKD
jgi:LAO/AO transport system kinase